jgi:hypothetical protein
MARRSAPPPQLPKVPLALTVRRVDATHCIIEQIERGKAVLTSDIKRVEVLDAAQAEKRKWRAYVSHLLSTIFTNDDLAQEFQNSSYVSMIGSLGGRDLRSEMRDLSRDINQGISCLESLQERLDLIPESPKLGSDETPLLVGTAVLNRKVFVVHGHDEAAKLAVAGFLRAIDFEPIILHEQANRGDTIIEKFERHADVGFAVVILSPDDIGGPRDAKNFRPRARQNVIAELGYFVGRLQRGRVLPLMKGELEIPSDFSGVVYTDMDSRGRWKTELANELDAAGFDVDFRKVARA